MQRAFEKIIERLEIEKNIHENTFQNYEMNIDLGSALGIEDAIKIVNQVISEYDEKSVKSDVPTMQIGNGWIPVSERLPDEEEYLKNDGMFIVSDGDYVYETMFDICNSRFCEDYFSITPSRSRDACIIAWQPLPIIYKPSAQETS